MSDEALAVDQDARDHHVVCGLNGLGLRLVEHLRAFDVPVVLVAADSPPGYRAAIAAVGVPIVDGQHHDEDALRAAGLGQARSIAFVADDDVGNLRGALIAAKVNPDLRIVLRLYNEQLGERIKTVFSDCVILSQSAIAAPFFAAAAMGGADGERLALAGRALLVSRLGAGDTELPEPILLPLMNVRDDVVTLFPDTAEPGGEVLMDLGAFDDDDEISRAPTLHRHRRPIGDRLWSATATVRQLVDRRLRRVLTLIVAALAVATTYFTIAKGLSPLDALYFSVVTLSTVGYGDINLQNDPPHVKVFGIFLIVFGAAIIAIFAALLTDTFVGARLARVLGSVRGRVRGHVIICGLGNVGVRIAHHLVQQGVHVVAVERDEQSRHVAAMRRMGIAVVIGDATLTETLHAAQVETAIALVAATDDDVADLETAVNARSLHPDLRIILRLFDQDLSTAIERRFNIHISRSSAALAAPVFATQMLNDDVVSTVTCAGVSLTFAEIVIQDTPPAATVGALEDVNDLRVLAISETSGAVPDWSPARDAELLTGQRLALVGRPTTIAALRSV